MFYFQRERAGDTEVFSVLAPEGSLPNAEERFGPSLKFDHRVQRFHDVGVVVLIHSDKNTEFIVACKGSLDDSERAVFDQQLEMLAGHSVYEMGGEPENGWFWHDSLKD